MQTLKFFSTITMFLTKECLFSCLFVIFIGCKSYLLYLINANKKHFSNQTSILLFMIPLAIYIITDFAWIMLFYENIFSKNIFRLAWFSQPLQFYSLSLFLHSMINAHYILSKKNKIIIYTLLTISILLTFYPTTLKLTSYLLPKLSSNILSLLEAKRLFIQFLITTLGILFLLKTIIQVRLQLHQNNSIPYILKLQLHYFFIMLSVFIIPETIFAYCSFFPQPFFPHNSILLSISATASFTFALMFYARKIYQLRFLNLIPFVQSSKDTPDLNFELYRAKRALCETNNLQNITTISSGFFKNSYNIAPERVIFSLRIEGTKSNDPITQHIEKFIQHQEEIIKEFFKEDAILIYDELAFTHFYKQTDTISQLLAFLNTINAAIFIPLIQGERILGSLIILRDQKDELFPIHKQTLISLYGTYVTYSIIRLESEQFEDIMIDREKQITAVYKAHQKIARYQESFSQIMKSDHIKKQGLVLFKNATFTFVNNAAEELLQINPNLHQGHPLTKALKEIVRRVGIYGNPYTMIEKNILGDEISCHGFPYKSNEVIILIAHADILQALKFENIFINPTDIDYFIFLHTTEAGSIVNTALPAKTTEIQKIKVQLLKMSLSKKALYIDVHDDDLEMFVGLIHRISLKKTLHTINLSKESIHDDICMTLFGVQQFNLEEKSIRRGLLQKLDDTGILYIKNIHLLDLKTQNLLTQFIKTGSFNLFKSEQKIFSNVTIICSSTENLKTLTEKGLFSEALYMILKEATITVPSFLSLPFNEIEALASGIQKQSITVAEYHHFFGFSAQERENLDTNRPISFCALHDRVTSFIKQRMKHIPIIEEISTYAPENKFADPILVEAVRLGKQALKDRKIMRELWDKLKSQAKIAQLLSVDRSSVHRRCKEFGLIIEKENINQNINSNEKVH